jgi:hypothetical protein
LIEHLTQRIEIGKHPPGEMILEVLPKPFDGIEFRAFSRLEEQNNVGRQRQ